MRFSSHSTALTRLNKHPFALATFDLKTHLHFSLTTWSRKKSYKLSITPSHLAAWFTFQIQKYTVCILQKNSWRLRPCGSMAVCCAYPWPSIPKQLVYEWDRFIQHKILMFAGPVVSAALVTYGARSVVVMGILFITVGSITSAHASEIYYLYLTFGVIAG